MGNKSTTYLNSLGSKLWSLGLIWKYVHQVVERFLLEELVHGITIRFNDIIIKDELCLDL